MAFLTEKQGAEDAGFQAYLTKRYGVDYFKTAPAFAINLAYKAYQQQPPEAETEVAADPVPPPSVAAPAPPPTPSAETITPQAPTMGLSPAAYIPEGSGMAAPDLAPSYLSPFDVAPPTYAPPPGFQAPPPFTYEAFAAPAMFQKPTAESILSDPSYLFRLNQGKGALENAASARGVLNSGGTLADVLKFGQNFASQEYNNIFNRDFNIWDLTWDKALSAYQTNRNNALSNYVTNYGIGTDTRDYLLNLSNNAFAQANTQWGNLRDLYQSNQDRPFNKLTSLASLGLGAI